MTSTTPTLDRYLSRASVARLAEQYDIASVEAAWRAGDYGVLHSRDSCECVGHATLAQAIESYEASYEGYIVTYIDYRGVNKNNEVKEQGLLSVWVTP